MFSIKPLCNDDLNTSIQMLINSSSDSTQSKMLVTATYIEADIKAKIIELNCFAKCST